MTEYNKERIRHQQMNLDEQINTLSSYLEETKYIFDDNWKEIEKMIYELLLTSGKIKDELF